jgi:photosystem II stability/assembly factor-like uncharacterized protein
MHHYTGPEVNSISSVSFVSDRTGHALLWKGDGTVKLIATTDGGRTWKVLQDWEHV